MRSLRFYFVAAVGAFVLTVPTSASAQLEACGDIHIEASAMCEVMVEGGCTAMCEPLSFTASCAADLQVGCESECNVTEIETCTDDIVEACSTECNLNPGMFNCQAQCTANVSANCSAQCSAMAGDQMAQARCQASCEATYEASCSADCNVQLPSLSCEEKCMEIQVTRCESEVNVDCQVDCQASGYAECEAELMGGCMVACTEPDGALFCDGQYVDHNDNLDMCIDALRSALDVEVDVSARGSSMCDGGTCSAEGEVSAGCAIAPADKPVGPLALFGLLAALLSSRARHRK